MRRLCGVNYGYFNLLRAALVHLPVVRFFVTVDMADEETVAGGRAAPPFCSQARVQADRAGGADPVPNRSDRLTEPGDLATTSFFRRRFTLQP
jgi:hypothetical protein